MSWILYALPEEKFIHKREKSLENQIDMFCYMSSSIRMQLDLSPKTNLH